MDRNRVLGAVSNGRIFSAKFTKKDGTKRLLVGRVGVAKGVKGVGRKFDPSEKELLGVYDMQKRAFRFVNLDTLEEVKANKEIIT